MGPLVTYLVIFSRIFRYHILINVGMVFLRKQEPLESYRRFLEELIALGQLAHTLVLRKECVPQEHCGKVALG